MYNLYKKIKDFVKFFIEKINHYYMFFKKLLFVENFSEFIYFYFKCFIVKFFVFFQIIFLFLVVEKKSVINFFKNRKRFENDMEVLELFFYKTLLEFNKYKYVVTLNNIKNKILFIWVKDDSVHKKYHPNKNLYFLNFIKKDMIKINNYWLFFLNKIKFNQLNNNKKKINNKNFFENKHDFTELFESVDQPSIKNYSLHNFFFNLFDKHYYKNVNIFFFKIKKKIKNNLNFFIHLGLFFKNAVLSVFFFTIFMYINFYFFNLSFLKTLSVYIVLFFLFFWLFSGFNFFIKRYRFSKYTSAIQRFWKRAFMCFWLIEGFLFTIFFYYLVNASGEPYFIYDAYGLYINFLLPIKTFLTNSFLIVLLINFFIFLLINIKFTSLKKNIYILFVINFIFIYLLFAESYQFYYLVNFYSDYIWNFSEDDNVWELDYDIPRTRNKNHYVTLLVIAKFWHYLFIFASWVFFIMKTLELNRIRYSLLSMNLQNVILFYIMNWLCLYSWAKWLFQRFFNQTYYWFFTHFKSTNFNIILNDLYYYFFNITNLNLKFFKQNYNFLFFYLFNQSILVSGQSYLFKFYLKNYFIN